MEPNNVCDADFKKGTYCRFDRSMDFEYGSGGLRIFIPTVKGYVNYNLVHSVCERKNCNIWRLGMAFAFDDKFEKRFDLTPENAEWDMALRLFGRSDFIGGSVHGDETLVGISAQIDGKEVDIESLSELTVFEEMVIKVESVGYDPDDSVTESVKHFKEYVINKEGITLNQRVEWLHGYTLGQSYMAMMPPVKALTDRFYTDTDPTPKATADNYGYAPGASAATVYGPDVSFSMSVTKYPTLTGGDRFLMTDNNGKAYNKIYFILCKDAEVSEGDLWETATKYSITVER